MGTKAKSKISKYVNGDLFWRVDFNIKVFNDLKDGWTYELSYDKEKNQMVLFPMQHIK